MLFRASRQVRARKTISGWIEDAFYWAFRDLSSLERSDTGRKPAGDAVSDEAVGRIAEPLRGPPAVDREPATTIP
jgi:hypothetical protein